MHRFLLFAAGLCCAAWLVGCGGSSAPGTGQITATTAPKATLSPAAEDQVNTGSSATSQPTAVPSPAKPSPEISSAPGDPLFDPSTADYTGVVTELTDTGFLLSPTAVTGGGTGVMASAGGSAALPVLCTENAEYIAIYAGADGSARQEAGSADLIEPDAYLYLTGSETPDGFTADAIAVLNP